MASPWQLSSRSLFLQKTDKSCFLKSFPMSSLSTPVSFLSAGSEVWALAGCACVCASVSAWICVFCYTCLHACWESSFYVCADVWMMDWERKRQVLTKASHVLAQVTSRSSKTAEYHLSTDTHTCALKLEQIPALKGWKVMHALDRSLIYHRQPIMLIFTPTVILESAINPTCTSLETVKVPGENPCRHGGNSWPVVSNIRGDSAKTLHTPVCSHPTKLLILVLCLKKQLDTQMD